MKTDVICRADFIWADVLMVVEEKNADLSCFQYLVNLWFVQTLRDRDKAVVAGFTDEMRLIANDNGDDAP